MSCTFVSLEAYIATPNLAEFLKENLLCSKYAKIKIVPEIINLSIS